ncbi:hypothetical protein C6P45_001647 [Maudiozyma exigua]|uniref:Uncharacterized protein n=1 Tax=Maudiozyma exigua TaxID=34358 RepID=A0A9P7BBP8_MAUEX|nr:hypothetical protein C6P45_001647 [Kazachstania exigua]
MTTYMPGYSKTETRPTTDPNETYRKTQSQIYSLQETILDSTRKANLTTQVNIPENKKKVPIEAYPDPKLKGDLQLPIMDSLPILNYTANKYKKEPELIGEIEYVSEKTGKFIKYGEDGSLENSNEGSGDSNIIVPAVELPYPYNFEQYYTPNCFLPSFNTENINTLVKIKIDASEINKFLAGDSKRLENRELWGTDIYTDDSDPLLALKHVGFFETKTEGQPRKRTPGNIHNQDNVIDGEFVSSESGLEVTVLLLDYLQSYFGLNRYGIVARSWLDSVPHDGLSFGIYEIKIINLKEEVNISSWNKSKVNP